VGSRVAARLRYPFVDTGSMYRAITWLALQQSIAASDHDALASLAESATLAVGPAPADGREASSISVNGRDVTALLRDPAVERNVSLVSAVPEVRRVMVRLQREAAPTNVVMAGRDIGTVVMPDAELKVYFEASLQVRAARRQAELAQKGRVETVAQVQADLGRRDEIDSNRSVSPLRAAADAVVIQTDDLSLENVVERVLALAGGRGATVDSERAAPGGSLPSLQPSPQRGEGDRRSPVQAPFGERPASTDAGARTQPAGDGWSLERTVKRLVVDRLRGVAWDRSVGAFYWLMTSLTRVVVATFGRYEVIGADRVPREGALIVVANHLNNADPPLLGASLPRSLRFMAKQELFDSKAGIFMRLFGAFPVRRFEADRAALRQAIQILKDGGALGMFPEGHRSHGEGMGPPHPGTALIALRSGATILPVGITGSEQVRNLSVLAKAPRIRVVVGEPFTLPGGRRITSARVHAGTDEIMRRIAALLPPRYRGVYAQGGPVPLSDEGHTARRREKTVPSPRAGEGWGEG